MKNYLNFEADIKTLEGELDKLKDPYNQEGLSEIDTNKISQIESEIDTKLNDIYTNLELVLMQALHQDAFSIVNISVIYCY